jgi:superoxide reductase
MKVSQICRCQHCGLQVEVTAPGAADIQPPVCCGVPMTIQQPNTVDAAKEKHVPVVEECDGGILVKVGSVPHPMAEDHYIEWIEVINGSYVNRFHLKPGDLPQAAFFVPNGPRLIIRESCNKHGVWEKK